MARFPGGVLLRRPASRVLAARAKNRLGRSATTTSADEGGATPKDHRNLDREGDSMTSLQAVRDRFARNEGLPFADVLLANRVEEAVVRRPPTIGSLPCGTVRYNSSRN